VAFSYHTSNEVEPFFCCVNLSLAIVVASDEEGGFGFIGSEKFEEVTGMLAWAVIEGQSNGSFLQAMLDSFIIGNLANQWPCIGGGVPTKRNSIAVTSTKGLLAVLGNAAIVGGVSLHKSEIVSVDGIEALTQ
jgi:hypothetical protein